MAHNEDVVATKIVRREFNRRQLDTTLTDIRVSHGVVYLRGTIKAMPGSARDVNEEVNIIVRTLRSRAEIRDVVIDLVFRT